MIDLKGIKINNSILIDSNRVLTRLYKMTLIDWIGFIGVFQILLAYILNVFGKVDSKDLSFILLNLFGAGLACLASILMVYYPFIILEAVWTFVSLFSLIKYRRRKTIVIQ